MAGTTGFLETQNKLLQIDTKEVPFIVRTVLGQLGWSNFFFDTGLATADRRKQLKRAGLSRALEHRVQVKWQKQDGSNGVYVRVQVDDMDGHATKEELKDACLQVLKGVFARAEEVRTQASQRERRTTFGSAKWANDDDLKSAGYVSDAEEGLSLILGLTDAGEQVAISPQDTVRHGVVGGPTGSGKTSKIIIPQMIKRWKASAIVTEATSGDEPPDVYQKTAGFRQAMGHKVYSFNPDLLTSHRINPIDQVKTVDDAQSLANLVIENSNKKENTGGGDPIWETSERHLLTALLLHAAGKKANLAEVRSWLTFGQDGMKQELMSSSVERAKSEYMAFYKVSTEGFRNGVISGLLMRLNLWVSPRIAALTETTDVDLDALHHELFTFYLSVPSGKGYVKPLAALIFNYIFSQTEKNFDMPLFLCLDEFTNFGRIPDFVNKMTIIRHRKIAAILGFQEYSQLELTYGRDQAKILWGQLGTKVMFKPNDLGTARIISEMLGTETYYERTLTSSGLIQEREFGRPLMNAGDVLSMGDERAIVFTPKTSPIKLRTYTYKDFLKEMAIAPPQREALKVNEGLMDICAKAQKTPDWQVDWQQTDPKEMLYIRKHIENTAEPKPPAVSKPVEIQRSEQKQESPASAQDNPPAPNKRREHSGDEHDEDQYGRGAII